MREIALKNTHLKTNKQTKNNNNKNIISGWCKHKLIMNNRTKNDNIYLRKKKNNSIKINNEAAKKS